MRLVVVPVAVVTEDLVRLQFGRVAKDTFTMDYCHPVCPLQGEWPGCWTLSREREGGHGACRFVSKISQLPLFYLYCSFFGLS